MTTKYTCANCGQKILKSQIVPELQAGFGLRHISCPECGQQAVKLTADLKK
jgi:DNA-directed RNA polymerase subunit RPC12/RpoP